MTCVRNGVAWRSQVQFTAYHRTGREHWFAVPARRRSRSSFLRYVLLRSEMRGTTLAHSPGHGRECTTVRARSPVVGVAACMSEPILGQSPQCRLRHMSSATVLHAARPHTVKLQIAKLCIKSWNLSRLTLRTITDILVVRSTMKQIFRQLAPTTVFLRWSFAASTIQV